MPKLKSLNLVNIDDIIYTTNKKSQQINESDIFEGKKETKKKPKKKKSTKYNK